MLHGHDFAKVSEKEQRAKLAFVCLLTAVGIPMILAGEEFVDQMESQLPIYLTFRLKLLPKHVLEQVARLLKRACAVSAPSNFTAKSPAHNPNMLPTTTL